MKHPLLLLALALSATGCANTPTPEETESSGAMRRRPPMFVIDEVAASMVTDVPGANNVTLLPFRVAGTRDVTMSMLTAQIVADSDGEFVIDIDGDVDPSEIVQDCSVIRDRDGAVVVGPEAIDAFDEIQWNDDASINGGIVFGRSYGHIECDLTNVRLGAPVAVAVMITDHSGVQLEDVNGDNISGFRLDLDNSGVNETAAYHVIVAPTP